MSSDPRIDTYIAKAAPFAQPILAHVRTRVHALVPDVEEAIKWGMPAYLAGGSMLLIAAAFKAHAALNFWRGGEIAGGSAKAGAMGQLGKIRSLEDLPSNLDDLIRDAASLAATAPAPRKPKTAQKPPPAIHSKFAAALAKAPKAKAALDGFPPSAQRDYCDWIGDARQEATRAKRIATAIEWLSEGKRRNWKHQNC